MQASTRGAAGANALTLQAPAKINLYLEVAGRRPDGYHQLVTVLQTVDLCDTLTVQLRERRPDLPPGQPDVNLAVSTAPGAARPAHDLPTDRRNLAVRAAEALLDAADATAAWGVAIKLVKAIPAGGGLGGGSSDAAAVVLALDALLGSPLAHQDLQRLCAALGSDVPFFLEGGTALCTGRGDAVLPIAPPQPFGATLCLPDFGVPTAEVYARLDAAPVDERQAVARHDQLSRSHRQLIARISGASTEQLERLFSNDLETPAQRVAPALRSLLAQPHTHLCGSGSSCFILDLEDAPSPAACEDESIRFVHVRSKNR